MTTDAERERLLPVLERPDDDTPRLVYADWLEDHAGDVTCPVCEGERAVDGGPHDPDRTCPNCRGTGSVGVGRRERAEFIRVQVELARCDAIERAHRERQETHPHTLPFGGHCDCARVFAEDRPCPFCKLRRRERELAPLAEGWWGLPLPAHTGFGSPPPGTVGVVARRGFVESVTLPLDAFVEHAGGLFRRHPITLVGLSDLCGNFETPLTWWARPGHQPGHFPPALAPHVRGYTRHGPGRRRLWFDFTSGSHGMHEVQRAAVAYGRALAGLPPLPEVARGWPAGDSGRLLSDTHRVASW